MTRRIVAIVGGGFSGAAVAFHLLREASAGIEIVLVEPAARIGLGLAYSTPSDSHRLNVPAGRLGLDAGHESGFVDWLEQRGRPAAPSDFLPRRWLGDYVESVLEGAVAQARARYRRVQSHVDAIDRDDSRFALRLSDGSALDADQVVLATGHLPTAPPPVSGTVGWADAGMVADPWRRDALADLPPSRDVLLVGSGLTAIDVLSQLRDDGHRGRIHLLSRRGLLPQPHRLNETRPPLGASGLAELGDEPTLRRIVRALRAGIEAATAVGGDWRDVMAGLRPSTPRLWQGLAEPDRRRFLRHLRPFWDTHRHRLAPAIHSRLQSLLAQGHVGVHAARLLAIDRRDDGQLAVLWRARGDASASRWIVARVVNCTGPAADLARARGSLLARLRDDGLLSADALGQGLRVDAALRPVGANGQATDGLYYVGPMLKATRWEATAVPELRVHARDVARTILAEIDRGPIAGAHRQENPPLVSLDGAPAGGSR
jgi:uncharacterized NAD(P)/FAD-binding protein YdhS